MIGIERFGLSPLIRFTMLSLYGALVLPLPLLAPAESRFLMVAGLLVGLVLVIGLLSERVETDGEGIQVRYPAWIRWLLRRGWTMRWQDIRALVPVGTSQGGTVYYLKASDLRHQLLPQRIERFDRFLELLAANTSVSTKSIGRLTPPWTYQLLAGLAVVMIAGELLTSLAMAQGWISFPGGYSG